MRLNLVPLLAAVTTLAISASVLSAESPPSPEESTPPGIDPVTGARPGNEIGTGMSLPTSDRSGNITPTDAASRIAGRLPMPRVDENASPQDFLLAARNALAAGRTGEAQEALERAETRLLNRSVPLHQTMTPIDDPIAERIQQVLHTLSGGDRLQAMELLEQAIATAASN